MQQEIFIVTGMTCGHCTAKVEKFLSKIEGVNEVLVELASGNVTVTGNFNSALVIQTIEKLGYTVRK